MLQLAQSKVVAKEIIDSVQHPSGADHGITRIVIGLKDDDPAKSPSRKEA
jgi:hypothetical protein